MKTNRRQKHKKTNKHKTNKHKTNKHKTRKHRNKKYLSRLARGPKVMHSIPPNGPVECSMCGKTYNRNDMLVPGDCLIKNRERAHRICQKCWWDKKHGFALEGENHHCPGCAKHMPLTPPLKNPPPNPEDIIELSG